MRNHPAAGVLLCALSAIALPSRGDTPLVRSFELHYQARIQVPAGAGSVEAWLPYPTSDAHQQISEVHVDAPVAFTVVAGDPVLGNSMLHLMAPGGSAARSLAIEMVFKVDRQEYVHRDFAAAAPPPPGVLPDEVARWLRPDRLVPLDDTIRQLANSVTAGSRTDLDKARAIYDYVVATMAYDKSGTGWGNGDIYWACSAKRGNCTDFHALFIGLCRAAGLPAKFEIGLPLPPGRGTGEIAGYHCWAEFYLRGYGWVPVDASEAKKHLEKKDYFFGAHDENRVQLSAGRDLVLSPKQAGAPLNYFVYPYVEVDGKPLPALAAVSAVGAGAASATATAGVATTIRFRDLP